MTHETTYGAIAGMILAAGRGTRMRPLSETIPKPLLPVLGVPIFEIIVERLIRSGAARIHANIFHRADRIADFVGGRDWPLTLHRERELLGTGGGVGNMADALAESDCIILQNGDILSAIEFGPAISLHRRRGALVTMIVVPGGEPTRGDGDDTADRTGGETPDRNGENRAESTGDGTPDRDSGDTEIDGEITSPAHRRPPPAVCVDGAGTVTAIGASNGDRCGTMLGYTGMAVLSPAALAYFPRGEPGDLIETLSTIIARERGSVIAHNAVRRGGDVVWGEIGSCEGYLDIHERILVRKTLFDPLLPPPPLPVHTGEGSVIDPGAAWRGFLEVGSGATIERDTVLEDCVVLDGTVVTAGHRSRRAVLYPDGVMAAG